MQAAVDDLLIVEENELPPQIEIEEEMKLREEDKPWFRNEIREAIRESLEQEITPLVDGKLRNSLRFKFWPILVNVSIVAIVVSVIVALFIYAQNEHTSAITRLGDEKLFEGTTKQKLEDMDGRLDRLELLLRNLTGQISGITLSQLSSRPANAQTAKQISSILDTAIHDKQNINPSVIAETGQKFIQEAGKNPDAWGAVTVLASYKSGLNYASSPYHPSDGQHFGQTHYTLPSTWTAKVSWAGHSPAADMPQLRPIDQLDRNQGNELGPAYLLATGGVVPLDGLFLKKIIISNSTVVFHGGPIHLENVYFVNCKFEWQPTNNTFQFASAILSPPPITNFSGQ